MQIQTHARELMALPDHELQARSAACQAFAAEVHTRPAYAASFEALLDRMKL